MKLTDDDLIQLIKEVAQEPTFPVPVARAIITRYHTTKRIGFHLGVTGTRHRLPDAQYVTFTGAIATIAAVWFSTLDNNQNGVFHVHHGCATGADNAAHWGSSVLDDTLIHGHPGVDQYGKSPYRMPYAEFHVIHPDKPYLDRNADIVSFSDALLAAPQYPESDPRSRRSGTWQTIRLARKSSIPILITRPDGHIESDASQPLRKGLTACRKR